VLKAQFGTMGLSSRPFEGTNASFNPPTTITILMRNELLNTANKNERDETAAFTFLGLAALFAIGEAFADTDPLVMRPVQWNRGFAFVEDQTPRDMIFIPGGTSLAGGQSGTNLSGL
jgi:hypothetical protein